MTNSTLSQLLENLGGEKNKGSNVNTSEFKINNNVIYYSWDNKRETALQIANIAQIDVGPAPKEKISSGILFVFMIGIIGMAMHLFLFGLIMIALGGVIIYMYAQRNQQAGDNLIIHLNNGNYFLFNFKDKVFFTRVFNVLIDCINDKISEETIINISNSTIQSSTIGNHNQVVNS